MNNSSLKRAYFLEKKSKKSLFYKMFIGQLRKIFVSVFFKSGSPRKKAIFSQLFSASAKNLNLAPNRKISDKKDYFF